MIISCQTTLDDIAEKVSRKMRYAADRDVQLYAAGERAMEKLKLLRAVKRAFAR
jgi:hypothetical protein